MKLRSVTNAFAIVGPLLVMAAAQPMLAATRAAQPMLAVTSAAPPSPPVEAAPTSPSPPSTPAPQPVPPSSPPEPVKPAARTRIASLPPTDLRDGTARLRVRLSAAVAPGSPAPMLTPRIAGVWRAGDDSEYFTPKSTLEPCSTYQLTVWAGTDAVGRTPLGRRRTIAVKVACPSLRGLQQGLARLGYLPYALHSHHGENARPGPEPRAVAARYAFRPPAGPLLADVPHAPGLGYGRLDTITRGAVMVFQSGHGLPVTGLADRSTWASLLAAETIGRKDPRPYTFVTVSERIPETLEVHRGHHVALKTPVNTGVPGATTERGTFPIFERFTSTTMTGTNPDGSHYSDPGVPWVNYFNGGDAVHGFPRPSYGTPQSNGCVELPIGTAEKVYRMLSIGDLVIVGG
jgi:peptidoglycan hydrolase-like protein with peptidoglycan-binding domain